MTFLVLWDTRHLDSQGRNNSRTAFLDAKPYSLVEQVNAIGTSENFKLFCLPHEKVGSWYRYGVCSFMWRLELLNEVTDFKEILYDSYALRDYQNSLFSDFLQSVTSWRIKTGAIYSRVLMLCAVLTDSIKRNEIIARLLLATGWTAGGSIYSGRKRFSRLHTSPDRPWGPFNLL